MIHFQYPEYLMALAAIPVALFCFYFLRHWKKSTAKSIGDVGLVKSLTKDHSSKKFNLKFILWTAAFVLGVLAVAGLAKPDGTQLIKRKGKDIVIALDVSNSMLATDIQPSRLARAKQLTSKLIENFPDHRIGLVLFAGRAYLQMPLTTDHEAAKMYISAASPDDIPTQGTVISEALRMSFAAFNPNEKTFKSILLISDGEGHDDEAIEVAEQLGEQGIMINTIGVGSSQGAPIRDPITGKYKTNDKGETVITSLNAEELKKIAKAGNGSFQLLNDPDIIVEHLGNSLKKIDEKALYSDSSYASFKQYYFWFLAAALFLLVLEFFITDRKRKKNLITAALFPALLFSVNAFGQQQEKLQSANEAFKKGNFEKAEKGYRQILSGTDTSVSANYNLGNTLYRENKPEESVNFYNDAIRHADNQEIKQKAFYNKGVAYQKAEKIEECILAYKNALLLDPHDKDARQNLQRALKKKQEQQQQKKNKPSKDKKDRKQQPQPQKQQQNPARISKEDALQKLEALLQNEKQLQDKLKKIKGSAPNHPDKDW